MSAIAESTKTPLDFALSQIATEDVKRLVLTTTHALVSTCMTQAMIASTGKPADVIAAEAMAYARQLQELERHLGAGYSNVQPPPRKVAYTTPGRLPSEQPANP